MNISTNYLAYSVMILCACVWNICLGQTVGNRNRAPSCGRKRRTKRCLRALDFIARRGECVTVGYHGQTDNLEILIEPVPYAVICPKAGRRTSGLGDTEFTLTYRFSHETPLLPAIAVTGEVKIPLPETS